MKAVFVYDHDFIRKEKKIFSSGAFSSDSWSRYLEHFDTLTVVGQEVKVDADENKLNRVERDKVSFKFLPAIKSLSSFIRNIFFINKELESIIAKHDAVIVRMYSEWAFQAIKIARKLNKPYSIELVGCPWDAYIAYPSIKAKILAPFAFLRLRKAVAKSKFVLYVTEKFLQKRYPTKGNTIGASNVMLIKPEQTSLENKIKKIENLDFSKDKLLIGVIGKIDVKAKGIDVLIKAVSESNNADKIKINIVGPGDPSKLQKLIKELGLSDLVTFQGKLPAGDQINQFLDTLHLYVHPSKQEGLPRSVIEAMARACPILASSIAGTPELIDENYLHKPGNYIELSAQLNQIVNNPHTLRMMSVQNFNKAKNYYPEVLKLKRGKFWSEFYSYAYKTLN